MNDNCAQYRMRQKINVKWIIFTGRVDNVKGLKSFKCEVNTEEIL